jgi:hypothetical protein
MKKERLHLSAGSLWKTAREYFETNTTDPRKNNGASKRTYSLSDYLMNSAAIFSLKFPSLLQFTEKFQESVHMRNNLTNLFGINSIPSDTQLRTVLDEVNPREIRGIFKKIFSIMQRGNLLKEFIYHEDAYLVSLDGTGFFLSKKVSCENCCIKNHSDGTQSYYHQMLAGVLIHPEKKAVIPFAPEPIIKQDGTAKNDCERNAAERFLRDFRREHPFLKVIITEDGLSSNTPHIKTLEELDFSYILGCKQGDHQFLFESIQKKEEAGELETLEMQEEKITHRFRWTSSVQLNSSSPDCVVNFLEYWEIKDKKTTHWSWVTNLALNQNTVYKIMKAGRARWRIENETFNTLKNQGYEFEHNFGHGYKNLSNVFAMQMMLAFCIDQILQLTSKIFQKALLAQNNRKKYLWETIKFHAMFFSFSNWDALFTHIAAGTMMNANPTLYYDTS